jgi:choline-sulfatase
MARMVSTAGPVPWSAQLDYDESVHFHALERIRRLGRRRNGAAEQPWFLCVSYTQPHDPYNPDQEHWDRYEGVDIPMPEDPQPVTAPM